MVLPDSDGVSRVPPYSGSWTEEIQFRLQGSHLLWLTFPCHSVTAADTLAVRNPQDIAISGLASSVFARRYSQNLV